MGRTYVKQSRHLFRHVRTMRSKRLAQQANCEVVDCSSEFRLTGSYGRNARWSSLPSSWDDLYFNRTRRDSSKDKLRRIDKHLASAGWAREWRYVRAGRLWPIKAAIRFETVFEATVPDCSPLAGHVKQIACGRSLGYPDVYEVRTETIRRGWLLVNGQSVDLADLV